MKKLSFKAQRRIVLSLSCSLAFACFVGAGVCCNRSVARNVVAPEICRNSGVVGEKHDTIFNGMFFQSFGVVDAFWYGNVEEPEKCTYYVVYDDLDAGCDYEVIRVDCETYWQIVYANEKRVELVGNLVANSGGDVVTYNLAENPDFRGENRLK